MAGILWLDEDFDRLTTTELNASPVGLFNNSARSWTAVADAGAGDAEIISNVNPGHKGILRLSTGAVSANASKLFLARDLAGDGMSSSEGWVPFYPNFLKMDMWVRFLAVSSISANIGIGQDVANGMGTDAFHFRFDSGVSPNWQCITRTGGVNTTTDSGIAVSALTWYKLTLRLFTASNLQAQDDTTRGVPLNTFRFYINDVGTPPTILPGGGSYSVGAHAHHTTNLPTGLTSGVIGAWVRTNTAAVRSIDIDRIRCWVDEAVLVG